MNHENTKFKKNEILELFFVVSPFRDVVMKKEHRTSDVQHRIMNVLLTAESKPVTRNRQQKNIDFFVSFVPLG